MAIIAILAAIAVPNFLEAQTRAKVSRIKSDMRTMATALESCQVDENSYPPVFMDGGGDISGPKALAFLQSQVNSGHTNPNVYDYIDVTGRALTTPVAYLTSIPHPSPFQQQLEFFRDRGFLFLKAPETGINPRADWWCFDDDWGNKDVTWALMDGGPNQVWFTNPETNPPFEVTKAYDPTNGTISAGNIWRTNQGIKD